MAGFTLWRVQSHPLRQSRLQPAEVAGLLVPSLSVAHIAAGVPSSVTYTTTFARHSAQHSPFQNTCRDSSFFALSRLKWNPTWPISREAGCRLARASPSEHVR